MADVCTSARICQRTFCKSDADAPCFSHHCISFVSIAISLRQEEGLTCNGVVLYLLYSFFFLNYFSIVISS